MNKPVTVLHVRNSIAYGGVETTLLGWLDNIDRSRFDCPIALFGEKDGAENAFRRPLTSHGQVILDLPWWPGRQFSRAVDRLAGHIRETGARLLHTHDWRSDVVGYHAARKTRVPIMTTVYVWFRRPLHILVKETIDSLYIRHFDLVTAVCEATRRQTVRRGVAAAKTDVLISGISPSRRKAGVDRDGVRSRFGVKPREIAFVYVARLYPEKTHATLLDAFRLALRLQPDLKLLLLGKGPLESAIRRRGEQLGISDRVILPGFVSDVPEVLQSMDVMVHASLAEGIPLAVYEGMLAGLPVIGSDVDGIPEVVIPGETGWLVRPGDSRALAERIAEAAEQGDLRERFGRRSQELILEKYNMDIAVQRLQATYDGLLGNG